MTNRALWLGQNNRRVDSRGRAMGAKLHRWLQNYALAEYHAAVEQARVSLQSGRIVISKAKTSAELRRELLDLLTTFGLRQFSEDGQRAAKAAGGSSWVMRPRVVQQVIDQKAIKVVLLMDDTRDMIRESLRDLIGQALAEDVRPSVQEMSRRIARQWFGPPSSHPPGREGEELRRVTADWRKPAELGEPERLFSFERAYTIARTELGQVQNAAIAEGFQQAGVRAVKWLAYRDDKSGKRRHYLMNRHKAITVEDMAGNDPSRWFELPSGLRTPYPQWMGLPAGESVNCRCTTRPI